MEQTTTAKNTFPIILGVIFFLGFYLILGGWDLTDAHNIRLIVSVIVGILAGVVAKLEKA